jgi:hypothetical protein
LHEALAMDIDASTLAIPIGDIEFEDALDEVKEAS